MSLILCTIEAHLGLLSEYLQNDLQVLEVLLDDLEVLLDFDYTLNTHTSLRHHLNIHYNMT